jgi:hypothetical protein
MTRSVVRITIKKGFDCCRTLHLTVATGQALVCDCDSLVLIFPPNRRVMTGQNIMARGQARGNQFRSDDTRKVRRVDSVYGYK